MCISIRISKRGNEIEVHRERENTDIDNDKREKEKIVKEMKEEYCISRVTALDNITKAATVLCACACCEHG